MSKTTFEDAVTCGQAQWLTYLKRDSKTGELLVGLTHDPEHSKTQRVLRFQQVAAIENEWTDRDDGCIEGLIGAHEQVIGSGARYTLVTDQREIVFHAAGRASIHDELTLDVHQTPKRDTAAPA